MISISELIEKPVVINHLSSEMGSKNKDFSISKNKEKRKIATFFREPDAALVQPALLLA